MTRRQDDNDVRIGRLFTVWHLLVNGLLYGSYLAIGLS